VIVAEYSLTCSNHPDQTTSLRCNKCNKPICARCAVQTPVGYRCRDCLRSQQVVFETARALDSVIAFIVGLVGVGAAVFLLGYAEAWGILLAPVVGVVLAGVIRFLLRGRRGRSITLGAAIGGVIGAAIILGLVALGMAGWYGQAGAPAFEARALLIFLWPLVDGCVMIYVLYQRLKTPGT
jgi:hypothetical protein